LLSIVTDIVGNKVGLHTVNGQWLQLMILKFADELIWAFKTKNTAHEAVANNRLFLENNGARHMKIINK
jgi:hypothetical protein